MSETAFTHIGHERQQRSLEIANCLPVLKEEEGSSSFFSFLNYTAKDILKYDSLSNKQTKT